MSLYGQDEDSGIKAARKDSMSWLDRVFGVAGSGGVDYVIDRRRTPEERRTEQQYQRRRTTLRCLVSISTVTWRDSVSLSNPRDICHRLPC